MFRSLHMKLVLVLVILVISTMAVVGTFLINSISTQDTEDFISQMNDVFTPEFILTLERSLEGGAVTDVSQVIEAYSAQLGIDKNRMFFVLDGKSGAYLAGSDDSRGKSLRLSSNMLAALDGEVGQTIDRLSETFDIAVPLRNNNDEIVYIVGVSDNKAELEELNWNLLTILIRAIFFALVVAVLLSFLLSKTITTPVERLRDQATRIAAGDFGERAEVASTDEIGALTETFNEMAEALETTLREVDEERNKLDTLFKHMADGVVAFSSDGKLLHKNPAAEEMLGRELTGELSYADIFPNTSFRHEDLSEDGKFMELDYIAGSRILKMYLAPIMVGEGTQGVMAVLHDITAQQKLDQSRREFVANVSHELRTPLTNIKGYTETLIDGGDALDAETRKTFLDVVYNESDRMSRIVKDLLTLSRLDSSHMEMNMERMDIVGCARAAMQSMRLEAENQQITLSSDLPERLPEILGDKTRLEQVILNLVSNAVKYNRAGGSVTVSGGIIDKKVFIRVEDTGLGIPEEDIGRLFERFYRVDKARSRQRGGTGLGLAISKEIAEHHGGTITAESVYGTGSTFTLLLPIAEEENDD
ncbi:MAG: HAMP domain-containing protein [Clostridia bacterium]|nr:HAMP domain-containing protein [Clostridia bacterium]